MNCNIEDKIDETIEELKDSGVVPLDTIYGLTSEGSDFSELDRQYNINLED